MARTSGNSIFRTCASAVSLVSQEVFLFQGTVRDNVAYGSRKHRRLKL